MDDDRLDFLLAFLRDHHPGGFVNWAVGRDELIAALADLKRLREKPLHCPCCDGDHS